MSNRTKTLRINIMLHSQAAQWQESDSWPLLILAQCRKSDPDLNDICWYSSGMSMPPRYTSLAHGVVSSNHIKTLRYCWRHPLWSMAIPPVTAHLKVTKQIYSSLFHWPWKCQSSDKVMGQHWPSFMICSGHLVKDWFQANTNWFLLTCQRFHCLRNNYGDKHTC